MEIVFVTDGDPLLLVNGIRYVLPGCAGYDRTSPYQQDKSGYQWLPVGNDNAVRNIMSYSNSDCRIEITPMQRGVEYFYTLYKGPIPFSYQFESFYRNEDVDDFENDNFFQNASNINISNPQKHSFHLVPDQNSNYSGCDVDWVRFVAPCSNNLDITTSAITGKVNANTRLTLFNNSLVQLAQNDDISASNLFSQINWNFVAGQTYFIRIENMQNLVTGYYNLLIGSANSSTISGDNAFCNVSNLYSVVGLTAGATVVWTATPTGLATPNSPNAIQTTLTKTGDGVITLTARVTPVCGTAYNVVKNIIVGKGASFPSITLLNTTCEYTSTWTSYFYGACKEVPGATSYNWYTKDLTNANNPYNLKGYDFSTDFPLRPGNRRYNIKLIITTPCGNLETIEEVTAPNCANGGRIQLNPNPVTSILNLSVVENKENLNTDIQELIISDKMGYMVVQKKYTIGTKKIALSINNLKPDIYFVKTWDGKTWEVIQFSKQ